MYPTALTGKMRRASSTRRFIINLVMTCGCPAVPSVKTTNQDREPSMPKEPHGETASASSVSSVVARPAIPPSTAFNAAKKTKTAATIMMPPCTRSVYTDAKMPPVTQ